MIIALDYDQTYDADPELWNLFIKQAEDRGHRVYCVTCRRDTAENRAEVKVDGIPSYHHYFTNMASKRWFMEQQDIFIDVWVDDSPESVREGR